MYVMLIIKASLIIKYPPQLRRIRKSFLSYVIENKYKEKQSQVLSVSVRKKGAFKEVISVVEEKKIENRVHLQSRYKEKSREILKGVLQVLRNLHYKVIGID